MNVNEQADDGESPSKQEVYQYIDSESPHSVYVAYHDVIAGRHTIALSESHEAESVRNGEEGIVIGISDDGSAAVHDVRGDSVDWDILSEEIHDDWQAAVDDAIDRQINL